MVDGTVHPHHWEMDYLNLYIFYFTKQMNRMPHFCLDNSGNGAFSLEFAVNEVW